MFAFWRRLVAAKTTPYVRRESPESRALYEPSGGFLAAPPPAVAEVARAVAQGIGRNTPDAPFPVAPDALATAAGVFCEVASSVTGVRLDLAAPNAAQFDAVADHFVDPAVRPYFAGGLLRTDLAPAEVESWSAIRGSIRVPNAPDLYYGFGAACGEWLVRHRRSAWGLLAPLRPMQFFPDALSAGHTMCALPFSFVSKRLADPEGDNLNFKMDDPPMRRHLPRFPLIASPADATEAWLASFPAEARPLLESESRDRPTRALAGYLRLLERHPEHPGLLSVASHLALQMGQPVAALTLLRRLAPLAPAVTRIHLNIASLLADTHHPKYTDEITEHLRAAIRLEPGHLEFRRCLAEHLTLSGDTVAARESVRWLVDNDPLRGAETAAQFRELGVVLDD